MTPRILPALVAGFLLSAPALAQETHTHHGRTAATAVDRFYSTWMKPDKPNESCCNKTDCDEAEVRIIGGAIWAKRKRDALFRLVPAAKIEVNRDSPDGRNHLCAPNWNAHEVYCFVAGVGG